MVRSAASTDLSNIVSAWYPVLEPIAWKLTGNLLTERFSDPNVGRKFIVVLALQKPLKHLMEILNFLDLVASIPPAGSR